MTWRILSALIVLLAALTLITLGCVNQTAKVTEPLSTQAEKLFVTESGQVLSADDLGLTQAEMCMLEEKGIADVASAEVASLIAGFKVAMPAHIPEGFCAGKFMVQLSGGGMPEELKPKFDNTQVNQYYTWPGEKYPMFLVTQSPHKFGISGSEPTEICGRPGERTFTKAEPGDETPYDHLALGWESEGRYYAIIAVLGENLEEATLEKIACSVSID
jgi:hypothetical protein